MKQKQTEHRAQSTERSAKGPLGKLATVLPWILVICGIIGIIASAVIMQEKINLAGNPHYQPACNLNPIVSCGSVMKSTQAHVFGFMNPFIGLLGFPILVTVGMAMFAAARFKRWFWIGMQAGLSLGIIFAYWLLWQSVYRIRALCPYCLSVDVVLTTAWWYVTLYNFYNGNLRLPATLKTTGRFIKRNHAGLLVLWFVIVTFFILKHFWYYFGRNF